jgi:hypothetical protein
VAEGLTLRLRQLGLAPDRFGAAFAGMALVAVAGVAATAVWSLHLGGVGAGSGTRVDWSAWQPRRDGLRGAAEIAEHVWTTEAASNRAPGVLPVPFAVATHDVRSALRFHALVVHDRGGSLRVVSRKTIGFQLCASPEECALPLDALDQRRLVRRQALALALYSLSYLSVDRVVVVLPPRPDDDQLLSALFFDRADLRTSLASPLRETLNGQPPTESQLDGELGQRLDRLTVPHQYAVEQVSAPGDDAPILTLSPFDER